MALKLAAGGIDAEALAREIEAAIADKKRQGVYTGAELSEIASRPLAKVVEPHDLLGRLLAEFQANPARWNFAFDPEAIYRSSRGGPGRALEWLRRLLRPVQRLFWNPVPMISALSRQSDLNGYYVHLLHNLTLEVTRLNLEVQGLKNRALQLQGQLEWEVRRRKALETLATRKPEAPGGGA